MKDTINYVLLLTGCIQPNVSDILKIRDINERKKQYEEAIRWYVLNTNYKIVFCENSGTDISSLFVDLSNVNDRIEFLTFSASTSNEEETKSSREMEIIAYALKNSIFINNSDIIVKITGRLIYQNIVQTIHYLNQQIKTLPSEFVSCDLGIRHVWSDSRFFFATKSFYKRLLNKKELISIKYEMERALGASTIEGILKHELIFRYLPLPQRVQGIGGGFGVKYDISDTEYKINVFKHLIKKYLFDIHIFPITKKKYINQFCFKDCRKS